MLSAYKRPAASGSAPTATTQQPKQPVKMNWLGFSEKKPEQQQKNILPKQLSTDSTSAMDPDASTFGERRSSVTIVDDMTSQVPKRKESDFDRLYRISNLMHACGSKDD